MHVSELYNSERKNHKAKATVGKFPCAAAAAAATAATVVSLMVGSGLAHSSFSAKALEPRRKIQIDVRTSVYM